MHGAVRVRRLPAAVVAQLASGALKCFRQQCIQRMSRETQRGMRHRAYGRSVAASNKLRCARLKSTGVIEAATQVESVQHFYALAADEFAANSMTRISAGFP